MDGTPDTNGTTTADDGGEFGPREAAALLEQTTRQARRQFNLTPPVQTGVMAVVVLAAYASIWLSVRGQHPYTGPAGWAISVAYPLVFLVIGMSMRTTKRAMSGVGGTSRRQLRASIGVLLAAWAAVYVYMGALYHAGASRAIVYGLYPATGPLMIVGLVGAALAAGRQDWRSFGTTLAVALIAAGSAFAGPVDAWLAMGIGLCAALVVSTAVNARLSRA